MKELCLQNERKSSQLFRLTGDTGPQIIRRKAARALLDETDVDAGNAKARRSSERAATSNLWINDRSVVGTRYHTGARRHDRRNFAVELRRAGHASKERNR